jgi:hypothetical protein
MGWAKNHYHADIIADSDLQDEADNLAAYRASEVHDLLTEVDQGIEKANGSWLLPRWLARARALDIDLFEELGCRRRREREAREYRERLHKEYSESDDIPF